MGRRKVVGIRLVQWGLSLRALVPCDAQIGRDHAHIGPFRAQIADFGGDSGGRFKG